MAREEATATDPASSPASATGQGVSTGENGARWFQGIRIFSSAPHAPRARRPTDGLLLALALIAIVLLSVPAPGPTSLDTATTNLVTSLPGLAGWFWEAGYDLLIIWSAGIVLLSLFSPGRKRLLLDELLAVALGLGSAILAGLVAGTGASTSLHGLLNSSSPPIYLATRVAIATAVIVTASPHLARPLRLTGRWLLGIGAVASVALGAALPIGVLAGFLIGFASAALTHLLVGSPAGRLTPGQISEALDELGVKAEEIHEAELQPRGVAIALAKLPDGRSILVKIFGRDAWDGQLVATAWTAIWHRGARRGGSGRLEQVEHEAFVTLLAERAGVSIMPVVSAGEADEGDALLVLEAGGRPLGSLHSAEIDDALLRRCWSSVGQLHELGVSHGRLDAQRLLVRPDGSPALIDLGAGRVAAPEGELLTDRAQLLVTTSLAVGTDRAVTAAAEALGDEGLAAVLPFLQPAVFDHDTRKELRTQEWNLKDLRKLVAERTAADIPPLEPIRRVTWGSLIKLGIIALLAYTLISALANVGIDTIVEEFQQADWAWLALALAVTPFAQIPQAFSTLGATMADVRFWPVLMLQYGVQFIALAVPSSAARVALEIRFFERVGVSGAAAVSIGMMDSFSTFLIQMLMIGIILFSGVVSLNLSALSSGSSGSSSGSIDWVTVLIAIGLVVLALVIALLIPKTRAKLQRFRQILRERAQDAKNALRVLRRPKKLLFLFGGNLVAQIWLAVILGLCLRAFGHSASLAALILVNTFVSLFAGFMPVPGGVGVAEAGYTAALIAIGIPQGAATSTALAYRLVTFYIPPVWGTFAMRWMKQNSYL